MNEWSRRTLQLVKTRNYLDRLHAVYPHEEIERNVDEDVINSIKAAHKGRNDISLLNLALDLKKFPYKDSYVGFLRRDRSAIELNPFTAKRICDILYEKGIDEIVRGANESMEANRRRGNKFTEWTKKNFKLVGVDEFKASKSGVVLLDASELEAKDFCNREIGVGISKRPDLVAKSDHSYIIGEAKFLSELGGSQDRGFDDGMTLAKNPTGKAYKVFIMDGVYWIATGSAMHKQIVFGTAAVFSVLLLDEFLQSVSLNKT